ncbi:uncharacterized protein LOC114721222 [Neltuma alba]|uniref:uncharacterized protein LOC114721222 n=1 Tax=Neltuma alba TaxID=207710 RepID=UPI0010A307E7|nr:uncharacterized protein LOC114721222 [Prosopis alba]
MCGSPNRHKAITSVALQWTRKAEELIDVDTKKEKCFNDLCLNCWHQYQKGKDLAKRTLDIDKLLNRCNSDIVASPIDLPGIKYRCLPNFMHFESRKSTFEELKKALENEENSMLGLQGLGGTGKTSMATEVGAELEGSTFGKVIFLVVSKLPDFKKLRGEIARNLDLKLENGLEEVPYDKILTKIKALKERLLIVLDDVWTEFDPTKELGIPPPHLHKGCTILITTRINEICTKMDCQSHIHLDALTKKEALSLFLEHTRSSSNLEILAQNIVEHCHGVPVVIVAVARSLKGRPSIVWKEALRNLQSGEPIFKVRDYDLKGVYEGLKLSYDNLKNEKAKKLLLISSLFPEDFEIPMEFLIRIGAGMGPFWEVDDYNERRRKVIDAIVELLDSSLLLNAERECVKMHDLVHEVALLIGEKDVQSVIESKPPKEGLQCLFWKSDCFPRHFDGRNLEVLLWVLDNSKDLEVPDTFFKVMKKLKVWFLWSKAQFRISAPSLLSSIQSLQNIRTLQIGNFELCNSISMLGRLPNLESLWFDNCSIIKSPEENFELEKLRFLRIENCDINMSNPFEVIEACPKLEELTFLSNEYDKEEIEPTISHKASFHTLQTYHISCDGQDEFLDYFEQCGSLSRCFKPNNLRHLISEATFEQLARTAELLSFSGYRVTKQKNLVPDIVLVDNRGMTDLIILQLDSWPDMQCLIDAVNNHLDVKNAFSNLVGLYLSEMGLSNILFNGHYNLCHLKTLKLNECPKLTSIFLPSTAQSLLQLEELNIERCDALECILEDKSSRGKIASGDVDNDQKSYDTLFPKFKILEIDSCDNLEIILPILLGGWPLERITILKCKKLKYIFDKFQEVNVMLPTLESMELYELPSLVGVFREYEKCISLSPQRPAPTPLSTKTRSFSWAQVCCFKSKATSKEADGAVSTGTLLDEGIPQGLLASKKWIDTAPTLGRQLALHVVGHIRKMNLVSLSSNSVSTLFTLSMASVISWEELTIIGYDGLKQLVTSEDDDYKDQINCSSIFPKLRILHISECKDLEFLFLSAISVEIKNLKFLTIGGAPQLTYLIEKYQHQHRLSNQNQNDEWHFDLPALEVLCLERAPKFTSIGPMNYKMVSLSLQHVCSDKAQLNSNATKGLFASKKWIDTAPPLRRQLALHVVGHIRKMKLESLSSNSVSTLFTLSMASVISWEELTIIGYDGLKQLVTSEDDDYKDQINCSSIFPKLQKLHISECKDLEFLFLSAISVEIKNLKFLTIGDAPQLTYLIEKYQHQHRLSNQNQNDEWHFDLRALEVLCLERAPKFTSIGPMNYEMVSPSLQNVCSDKAQLDLNTTKEAPTHTSPNLDVLPTRDNTYASAKSFEEKEEEEEDDAQVSDKSLGHAIVSSGSDNLRVDPETTTTQLSDHSQNQDSEVREEAEQNLSPHLNGRQAMEPQQSTIGSLNFTINDKEENPSVLNTTDSQKASLKVELGAKEKKETIMMEPQSRQETTIDDVQSHEKEEEGREGGLITLLHHQSEVKVKRSLLKEKPETFVHDGTKSNVVEDTKLSLSPFSIPIEMMPSLLEANNQASTISGVQEIVDMMKLEGFEHLIFAKALETRPQLRLSTKDRSARVLHMSYRVLLDILNILTTRTPFTITEADKRMLAEHLKDAYLLGFDKDWIESIKNKVFYGEICKVDSIQNVLEGLDNDLRSNEAMLEAIRDEEIEAARVAQVAQQEHANVMARHAHLLKERQDIIERRQQCWEIIAAKHRPFGF